ncbi:crotonobetaine/carnitine-CoA ligase [Salmonella enterica subsp. enterica]|uniref:Crotonobetaine/carnitine-CoA ligase n=1 Tax=Salmonella enterica I TaxID=59201 RepID=A0A3S4GSH8_SALET|nr:crotonobetaine/carnitine-CoA ligase [Salmonella enterica subsp. enterica]
MIKRGGENVSLRRAGKYYFCASENSGHCGVGIKDAIRDEAIKAFIVLNEGETLSEAEFFSFCEKQYGEIQGSLFYGDQNRPAAQLFRKNNQKKSEINLPAGIPPAGKLFIWR